MQLREDEIDRLVARFKQTGSVKDDAVEFGISRQTAAKHIKDLFSRRLAFTRSDSGQCCHPE